MEGQVATIRVMSIGAHQILLFTKLLGTNIQSSWSQDIHSLICSFTHPLLIHQLHKYYYKLGPSRWMVECSPFCQWIELLWTTNVDAFPFLLSTTASRKEGMRMEWKQVWERSPPWLYHLASCTFPAPMVRHLSSCLVLQPILTTENPHIHTGPRNNHHCLLRTFHVGGPKPVVLCSRSPLLPFLPSA